VVVPHRVNSTVSVSLICIHSCDVTTALFIHIFYSTYENYTARSAGKSSVTGSTRINLHSQLSDIYKQESALHISMYPFQRINTDKLSDIVLYERSFQPKTTKPTTKNETFNVN
jgi:hypothetical protein